MNDNDIDDFGFNDLFIDSIDVMHIDNGVNVIRNGRAFVELSCKPNNTRVNFKIDTGSQVNILPANVFFTLKTNAPLEQATSKLTTYNGHKLNTLGVCKIICCFGNKSQSLGFYVVETESPLILGLKSCLEFSLIQFVHPVQHTIVAPLDRSMILTEYYDVFQGIGLFKTECNIVLDPSVSPVVNPPRRVPIALRDRLKAELDRMESLGVIAKVTKPTPWLVRSLSPKNRKRNNYEYVLTLRILIRQFNVRIILYKISKTFYRAYRTRNSLQS